MKKVFILATLISTSAFGFEYGTPAFKEFEQQEFVSCINMFSKRLTKNEIETQPFLVKYVRNICSCTSYCEAEKINDVSYMYSDKGLEKAGKILVNCLEKCTKMYEK